jgi:hypothetical protein
MRRKSAEIRLCAKCGGELRPPARPTAAPLTAQPAVPPPASPHVCIVCGNTQILPMRRRTDFRETLPE